MIPGTTTKISEMEVATTTTIHVQKDMLLLTGTEAIDTMIPHFGGGFSGLVVLVPTEGDVDLLATTTGNIAVAVTLADLRATLLVYSKETETWYPGAVS